MVNPKLWPIEEHFILWYLDYFVILLLLLLSFGGEVSYSEEMGKWGV